jgi:hypothetical protein
MQAYDLLWPGGRAGDLHDRDRGRVGRQDRVWPFDHPIKFGEQRGLDSRVLRGGLDGQVTVAEITRVGGDRDALDQRVALRAGVLTALKSPRQRGLDPSPPGLGRRVIDLTDDDVKAGPATDLDDAEPHQAAADDADSRDVAQLAPLQTLRPSWPPTSKHTPASCRRMQTAEHA